MPVFKVTDQETGQVFNITGATPPTEREILELLDTVRPKNITPTQGFPQIPSEEEANRPYHEKAAAWRGATETGLGQAGEALQEWGAQKGTNLKEGWENIKSGHPIKGAWDILGRAGLGSAVDIAMLPAMRPIRTLKAGAAALQTGDDAKQAMMTALLAGKGGEDVLPNWDPESMVGKASKFVLNTGTDIAGGGGLLKGAGLFSKLGKLDKAAKYLSKAGQAISKAEQSGNIALAPFIKGAEKTAGGIGKLANLAAEKAPALKKWGKAIISPRFGESADTLAVGDTMKQIESQYNGIINDIEEGVGKAIMNSKDPQSASQTVGAMLVGKLPSADDISKLSREDFVRLQQTKLNHIKSMAKRITEAMQKAGRDPEEIKAMNLSKTLERIIDPNEYFHLSYKFNPWTTNPEEIDQILVNIEKELPKHANDEAAQKGLSMWRAAYTDLKNGVAAKTPGAEEQARQTVLKLLDEPVSFLGEQAPLNLQEPLSKMYGTTPERIREVQGYLEDLAKDYAGVESQVPEHLSALRSFLGKKAINVGKNPRTGKMPGEYQDLQRAYGFNFSKKSGQYLDDLLDEFNQAHPGLAMTEDKFLSDLRKYQMEGKAEVIPYKATEEQAINWLRSQGELMATGGAPTPMLTPVQESAELWAKAPRAPRGTQSLGKMTLGESGSLMQRNLPPFMREVFEPMTDYGSVIAYEKSMAKNMGQMEGITRMIEKDPSKAQVAGERIRSVFGKPDDAFRELKDKGVFEGVKGIFPDYELDKPTFSYLRDLSRGYTDMEKDLVKTPKVWNKMLSTWKKFMLYSTDSIMRNHIDNFVARGAPMGVEFPQYMAGVDEALRIGSGKGRELGQAARTAYYRLNRSGAGSVLGDAFAPEAIKGGEKLKPVETSALKKSLNETTSFLGHQFRAADDGLRWALFKKQITQNTGVPFEAALKDKRAVEEAIRWVNQNTIVYDELPTVAKIVRMVDPFFAFKFRAPKVYAKAFMKGPSTVLKTKQAIADQENLGLQKEDEMFREQYQAQKNKIAGTLAPFGERVFLGHKDKGDQASPIQELNLTPFSMFSAYPKADTYAQTPGQQLGSATAEWAGMSGDQSLPMANPLYALINLRGDSPTKYNDLLKSLVPRQIQNVAAIPASTEIGKEWIGRSPGAVRTVGESVLPSRGASPERALLKLLGGTTQERGIMDVMGAKEQFINKQLAQADMKANKLAKKYGDEGTDAYVQQFTRIKMEESIKALRSLADRGVISQEDVDGAIMDLEAELKTL